MALQDNGVAKRAQLLQALQEEFIQPQGKPEEAAVLLELLEALKAVVRIDDERSLVPAKLVRVRHEESLAVPSGLWWLFVAEASRGCTPCVRQRNAHHRPPFGAACC